MARQTWLPLDLALVALFAVVGRLSHYDSLSLGGWWQTAWPFLVAAVLGWVALLVTGRPVDTVGAGVVVWLVTLGGGMVLRMVSDQGTAAPFVVVATLVLGALLVLPRAALWALRRAAGRSG